MPGREEFNLNSHYVIVIASINTEIASLKKCFSEPLDQFKYARNSFSENEREKDIIVQENWKGDFFFVFYFIYFSLQVIQTVK